MSRMIAVLAVAAALSAPHAAAAQHSVDPGAYAAGEEAYAAIRPMIADMHRIVTPDGVETTETVMLGGIPQWISIRGVDRDNPILIYVHGGPGASEMGRSISWRRGVEEFFTVVHWDQRGTGKTLRANGLEATRPTLDRERMASDLVELIDLLRARFGQRKVVLLGHSWGNVIGLDAALRRPDAVSAYVSLSPALAMQENERVAYARLLEMARERGDVEGLAALEALAPYPGEALDPQRLGIQRGYVMRYGGLAAYRDNGEFFMKAARLSPDYDLEDRQAIDAGGEASIQTLLPALMETDLRSVRRTPFPVVLMVGRHDLTTPPEVSEAWLEALDAPSKTLVRFEHSAHLAPHEEPGRFLLALVQHVLPLATAGAGTP
jgi:pimeloyl-ACP methyl ester carboxylesterase